VFAQGSLLEAKLVSLRVVRGEIGTAHLASISG